MSSHHRIIVSATIASAGFLLAPGHAAATDEATWSGIRSEIIGDRIPEDGQGLVTLTAPVRAEDAAIVPIEVRLKLPDGDPRRVTRLTLVIDENPAPVAAVFHFDRGHALFTMETRVRIDSYTFVRAIAETDDGHLYMEKAFVKAAGGCSAPALKDPAEAKAHMGEMRFRAFAERGDAQVQIRHPNFSGMQMDQVTRLYTPAWFIQKLDVRQGDKTLFGVEGGISLSEDPTFRFNYVNTGEPVTVHATDSNGEAFEQTFPASGS